MQAKCVSCGRGLYHSLTGGYCPNPFCVTNHRNPNRLPQP